MKTPPFVIVADRHNVKAYMTDPDRAWVPPQLVDTVRVEQEDPFDQGALVAHFGRDRVHAGAVLDVLTTGRMTLEASEELTKLHRISAYVEQMLQVHLPERWCFAAPAEINGAILDGVQVKWLACLAGNYSGDLGEEAPSSMMRRFEGAWA